MSTWEKWSSAGNEQVKCPVEGCGHIGYIITKAHLRLEHNMEREDVLKKYGFPTRVINKRFIPQGANHYDW